MTKIKQVLPSLREKKRYLAFKINSEGNFTKKHIETSINMAILNYMGELGYARAGPILVEYGKNKGILKVNNKELSNVRAGLSLITKVDNKKAFISSIITSGLLNKAKKSLEKEE